MATNGEPAGDAKHQLANLEQQKLALQHLLGRAVDEIEELVESDCDPAVKEQAAETAARLRKATEA